MRVRPTILWGARDAWIPLERSRDLAARIPGAALRVVEHAGHLVQEDRPEAVVAAVLETLAGRAAGADLGAGRPMTESSSASSARGGTG